MLVENLKKNRSTVVFGFCRVSFLADHFSSLTRNQGDLLDDQFEDFMYHCMISSSAPLRCYVLIPLRSVDFPS